MKKNLLFTFVISVYILSSCSSEETPREDLPENPNLSEKTYVPDDVFEKYLTTYRNDNNEPMDDIMDDYVLTSRIESLTRLDLSNQGCGDSNDYVTDLTGIENFTSLEYLDVSMNKISKSFDISKLKNLRILRVGNNSLEDLDVSNNQKLEVLMFHSNKIKTIDLTNNHLLIELGAGRNELENLDVSKNEKLTHFSVGETKISNIDLSKNPNLIEVYLSNNNLSQIDFSNNLKLESISCTDNKIKHLNFENNSSLTHLSCGRNPLETIEINNPQLHQLDITDTFITSLDLVKSPLLSYVICPNTKLSYLDVSPIDNLDFLVVTENEFLDCIKINQYQESDIYDGTLEIRKDDETELSQNCS